jgi:hypothetical protein
MLEASSDLKSVVAGEVAIAAARAAAAGVVDD